MVKNTVYQKRNCKSVMCHRSSGQERMVSLASAISIIFFLLFTSVHYSKAALHAILTRKHLQETYKPKIMGGFAVVILLNVKY